MNLKCLFGHQWNGCKCERCGETRTAKIVNESVASLKEIYLLSPRGEGFNYGSKASEPAIKIGKRLNDLGGKEMMLEAHERFSAEYHILGAARNLEQIWHGIGSWQG